MIEYRMATVEDADTLAVIRLDFFGEGRAFSEEDKKVLLENNRSYLRESLTEGSFVAWIALSEGEIVATSGVNFFRQPPNPGCKNGQVANIANMFTYAPYRKQGIATKLFALCVEEAKKRGCGKVVLNASDMGRPLYEKYGFVDTKGDMVYTLQ